MMDDLKLKPCPFCGEKIRISYSSVLGQFVIGQVLPYNCYFTSFKIDGGYVDSLAEAKEAWNRRVSNG